MSVYEEDASPGASPKGGGEPLSIALALRDNATASRKNTSSRNSSPAGSSGGDGREGEGSDSGKATGNDADAVDTVRAGVVAVDVRTGKVVYDAFVERAGQRRELETRLRHLK